MIFQQVDKSEIYLNHNASYHDDAIYYKISKNDKFLCIYGIISREDKTGEAFWVMDSFNGKVFSKDFFKELFKHLFSLQYKEIYTWTRCRRLVNIFGRFNDLGIEEAKCPHWDSDPTKIWFMKRI